MSMEVTIFPLLLDAAVLMGILVSSHRVNSVLTRLERGVLTEEQAADMRLEVEALQRAGHNIRSGADHEMHDSEVVIRTDDGYDLGLRRNKQGGFDLVTHWSQQPGKVEIQRIREDLEAQIKQKYAYEKVKRELAKKGFVVSSEEVQPDNTIRLVARKW